MIGISANSTICRARAKHLRSMLRDVVRSQRDQTGREIYREFLNLTVQKPELAASHYCAMTDENQRVAYEAYFDYLSYTAEQMIESDSAWKGPMTTYFEDHLEFICSRENRGRYTQSVAEIAATRQTQCAAAATNREELATPS